MGLCASTPIGLESELEHYKKKAEKAEERVRQLNQKKFVEGINTELKDDPKRQSIVSMYNLQIQPDNNCKEEGKNQTVRRPSLQHRDSYGDKSELSIDVIKTLAISEDLDSINVPGHWDVFISHTQRHGKAVAMAEKLATSLENIGLTVWLDVKMKQRSAAAMEEGVRNSQIVIAIITGATIDGNINNAYFSRPFCILELQWAIDAGIQIQPIVQTEDKSNIGTFLGQAPSHLQFLAGIDFIHLDRSDIDYWDVGVKKVRRVIEQDKKEFFKDEMIQKYKASHDSLQEQSDGDSKIDSELEKYKIKHKNTIDMLEQSHSELEQSHSELEKKLEDEKERRIELNKKNFEIKKNESSEQVISSSNNISQDLKNSSSKPTRLRRKSSYK